MRNTRIAHIAATTALLLASSLTGATPCNAEQPAISISLDDFGYLDTSNEPADQAAVHQKRLQAFMAALRGDVGADARYKLVGPSCASARPSDGAAVADRLQAASRDGAKILIVGNIQKMSTLVQWARAAAIDTASNRTVFDKLFSFRGDSDEAWQRAEAFVSEELRTSLAGLAPVPAAALAPIRLAVFPFELDDTSAAAEATGETTSDATGLADTTDAIRQLLAQSGRYQIINTGAAGTDAGRSHALHDCGGCDGALALGLGADQSLVGVIRRVSRTEYIVGFRVRDARSGTVVADADSGLRMGANYSWSRGATRLVRDRLLEGSGQQ